MDLCYFSPEIVFFIMTDNCESTWKRPSLPDGNTMGSQSGYFDNGL